MTKTRQEMSHLQAQMLGMEEKTAAFYLVEGGLALSSLQKSTTFYPAPFSLLANGLERLLKLDVALKELRSRGRLPTRREMKTLSHDLWTAADAALAGSSRASTDGRRLLTNDTVLRALITALNDFAGEGRYLYLDRLLEPGRVPV